MTDRQVLRIGHSPDPDDAFMWYPLAEIDGGPKVDTGRFRFEHVLEDIETLNQRSMRGDLEITALSIHQFAHVSDLYALTSCGASMGDGYGPMIVARETMDLRDLVTPVTTPTRDRQHRPTLAIPGERTSAWLSTQLMMKEKLGVQPGADRTISYTVVPFDEIIDRVVAGEYDAGLIIHEGQLTYADYGLTCITDLGKWWKETRGLPLPLGGNAIRRDLEADFGEICRILLASIEYALAHREEAVQYALNWARGMGNELADEFVGMYVNDLTLDYGERGEAGVRLFLQEAAEADLIEAVPDIRFVRPG